MTNFDIFRTFPVRLKRAHLPTSLPLDNIQIPIGVASFPAKGGFLQAAAMVGQKPDNIIGADPDLAVAFLLTFVEDQLDTEMQVDGFDVVHILSV